MKIVKTLGILLLSISVHVSVINGMKNFKKVLENSWEKIKGHDYKPIIGNITSNKKFFTVAACGTTGLFAAYQFHKVQQLNSQLQELNEKVKDLTFNQVALLEEVDQKFEKITFNCPNVLMHELNKSNDQEKHILLQRAYQHAFKVDSKEYWEFLASLENENDFFCRILNIEKNKLWDYFEVKSSKMNLNLGTKDDSLFMQGIRSAQISFFETFFSKTDEKLQTALKSTNSHCFDYLIKVTLQQQDIRLFKIIYNNCIPQSFKVKLLDLIKETEINNQYFIIEVYDFVQRDLSQQNN